MNPARYLLLLASAGCLLELARAGGETERVKNPTLASALGGLPAEWTAWLPEWSGAQVTLAGANPGLRVSGGTNAFAVGGVVQELAGIQGGQAYAVRVRCEMQAIPNPRQSVLVRMTWQRGAEVLHPAGVLIRGPQVTGTVGEFRDVVVAPAGADRARLSLELKWPRGGAVIWRGVSVTPTSPPATRRVRLGTAYLKPDRSTPERNLDLWCEQVASAGRLHLDAVCLSEAIRSPGTSASATSLAETVPGPTTERLGSAARGAGLWVVAGVYEVDAGILYNTAVLLDRQGRLAGEYRKVHLPREEWQKGIRPGDDYPVFSTDFGTIGIMVCYDYFFPETTEILAQRGAEIVFAPTWGTTFADQDGRVEGQSIFRVRARDNGVYLVTSVYDGESMVIDPLGRVVASNHGATGVFWAETDLAVREPLWWVGHWGSIGVRDRLPESYRWLTVPREEPAATPGRPTD